MAAKLTEARILVTDVGRGSAISIIRALGRNGCSVIASDSNTRSLGFRSRYATDVLVYPDPKQEPERFRDTLLQIVRQDRVDLVIPVTDFAMQPLARARDTFEPYTRLAIPSNQALAVSSDKQQTVQLARELGVPVPETRLAHDAQEALAVAPVLGWPVVLKPQSSYQYCNGGGTASFGVTYAASAADLEAKMARFEGRCAVLLQSYRRGVGIGVEVLASSGRILAAFQHRRLHEVPVTGGASTYRESCRLDPRLYDYARRLLERLRWTGLAMVEFKLDAEESVLMEINGRVWGSLPLAIQSGMDFPGHLLRLYLEGESAFGEEPLRDYRIGVRCRDLLRDLVWISAILAQKGRYPFLPIPRRRCGVAALLGLLDPRRKTDLGAWDDPIPALLQVPHIVPRLLQKARQAHPDS
jgi:predicted ATP-grasp superfamily ATP-dependent carboligase